MTRASYNELKVGDTVDFATAHWTITRPFFPTGFVEMFRMSYSNNGAQPVFYSMYPESCELATKVESPPHIEIIKV